MATTTPALWVGRDSNDSELILLWPVAPEQPVRSRSLMLHIGHEHFFALFVGMLDGSEFVTLQTGVTGIASKKIDALNNLFQQPFLFRGLCLPRSLPCFFCFLSCPFKILKGCRRGILPFNFESS